MRMLKTVGMVTILVITGVTAGCGEAKSPANPSPAGLASDQSVQSPGGAPALAAVRRATAAFHDVDKAIAAGYPSPVGGHCDEIAAGAMGIHSANPALLQNQALVAEQPEVLLYLPSGDGNYRLVGVEYVQTLLLRNTQTGQVGPWFSPNPWPAHYVLVNSTPSMFGQTFQGPMPGHVPGMPWHYDLHVWIWRPNPSGMFAQWNPSISCQAAGAGGGHH